MRTSILVWSTVSGLMLGAFVDALLIGVTVALSAVLPSVATGLTHRWVRGAALVALGLIAAAAGTLGFLEGRLKTR